MQHSELPVRTDAAPKIEPHEGNKSQARTPESNNVGRAALGASPPPSTPQSRQYMLRLQRQYGNRHVQQVIARQAKPNRIQDAAATPLPAPTLLREHQTGAAPGPDRGHAAGLGSRAADNSVSLIQRQPPAAPPAPAGAAAAPGTWQAPFELGTVNDRPGASVALTDVANKLQELKDAGFNETELVITRARALAVEFSGADALTREEANKLTAFGLLAVASHNKALNEMKELIGAALAKWTSVDVDNAADAAAEKVHAAFMGTASASKLADAKAMLGKVKELGKTISKYAGYASKTKSVIRSAEKLETLKKELDGFVGKIAEAEKLVGLVESIGTLAGKVGEMPGQTQGDIAKFKAAFNIADFVISKSKVPVIGEWWSEFIKPTAEMALKQVQKLDDLADRAARNNEARIDEWWQEAQRGGGPPQIAGGPLEGALMMKYFPGGQEMLNFMWSVFRGGATEIPRSIEQYFVKFKTQFSEGHEEEDKVPTEGGAVWYKPWTWFDTERSPKLLDWVRRNKEEVWAMLYGRLPHP
jgi:hypothetical protein